MAKYRKKPTIVEAVQFTKERYSLYPELYPGVTKELDRYQITNIHNRRFYLFDGDWIIREPDGIHYSSCNDRVFQLMYELVG